MSWFAQFALSSLTIASMAAASHAALFVNVTNASARPGQTVFLGTLLSTDDSTDDTSAVLVNAYNSAIYVDPTTPATGGGFFQSARTDLGLGFAAPQFLAAGEFSDGGDYRVDDLGANQSASAFNFLGDADAGESLGTANGRALMQSVFQIPANAVPGTIYHILVDLDATSFSTPGADSTLVPFTSTGFATVTVAAVPEPATLALLATPLLLLRRRRVTRA